MAALVAAAFLPLPGLVAVPPSTAHPSLDAIVVAHGSAGDAADAVVAAGGSVRRQLPALGAVLARLPHDSLAAVAASPAVASATADRSVHLAESDAPPTPSLPASVHRQVVGADRLNATGVDGTGVVVALVDTGVADVPQLRSAVVTFTDPRTGRVVPCVNLSGEAGCGDSYGHGTFTAALVAGRDPERPGVAPGARLISVKIAGRDGSADVGTVLAAVEWAVSFRERLGIRVLNLPLGTDSTQSYAVDPLNYAVERAWAAGLVVVVSASNRGPDGRTISKPGDDPFVLTVGALDDAATVDAGDDVVPAFSARGPTVDGFTKPDLLAPGANLVSLRAPGSAVDLAVPPVTDDPVYRAGSGTSMAAAVTSGAVALLLEAHPALAPDRVKHVLTATARPAPVGDRNTSGAGVLDVLAAVTRLPDGLANQGIARSTGSGTLHGTRGSVRVAAGGTVLTGENTQQLRSFDRPGYQQRAWTDTSWAKSAWAGSSWYGSSWYGSSWYGSSWYGSSWYGSSWYGSSWYGSSWYGSSWYGSSWYGVWQ